MEQKQAIGILGGTFDPVHYGHLLAAECARRAFGLERVILTPAAQPPHKEGLSFADKLHRLKMVKSAAADNKHFEVSELEIHREGFSYTVDTVNSLKLLYPHSPFFFIMGADALLLIKKWKNYQEITSLCNFIVVTRPGFNINKDYKSSIDLPVTFWSKVKQLEIPAVDISSSMIRQRIASGKPIKYLLPDAVESYIYSNNLYAKE
ncbi:MAG: nicotinate-nucleotide adenylyltransferase [Syntrophomonadaceae bacterium]|jgi:nicotinate-nucleotide adenylyltransferase|nr:nicotinate-nucleotide adenylyltransferase [Syntrophomonadaceae bacterium]